MRRPVAGSSSMMSMPVMSDGIRSGVNWMRRNSRSSVRASVRAIRVLPSPGTPSKQDVTAAEQADEHVVDDRFLADDHLGRSLRGCACRASHRRATMAASSLESAAGAFGLGITSSRSFHQSRASRGVG